MFHTHTQLVHPQLVHTQLVHTQLAHTQLVTWQAWHLATWTSTLRGRRGTYGTGLALVARLVPSWRRERGGCLRGRCGTWRHRASLCVAGVALGDIDRHFAWQAWHLWHWAGSHTIFDTPLCHTPSFTHTTLSLCHTPSFTHNFVTHHFVTPLVTHHFVTHHLCHTLFFTHNFVTHHLLPHHLSHTTLSHTPSFTHNFVTPSLSHTLSFTHNFVTHHL